MEHKGVNLSPLHTCAVSHHDNPHVACCCNGILNTAVGAVDSTLVEKGSKFLATMLVQIDILVLWVLEVLGDRADAPPLLRLNDKLLVTINGEPIVCIEAGGSWLLWSVLFE